jgi:CheY-like chemotaxis protein
MTAMMTIDDDAVFCEIADQLFSSLGYTVRCAEGGFEALAMGIDRLASLPS